MSNENPLREITADYIRELRKSGRGDVADKLLKAHYDSLEKVKKQEGQNFDFKTRQVKKHLGICSQQNCTEDICEESSVMCEHHFSHFRIYGGYKGIRPGNKSKYKNEKERKEGLRKSARLYYQKNKEKIIRNVRERYLKNKERTK